MALGGTAIQQARDSLRIIEKNLDSASTSNDEFKILNTAENKDK